MVASCSPPHSDDGTMPSLYGGASRQSWSSHSTHSTGLATPTTPSVAFPAVLPHNVAKDPYSARPIAHKSPASVVHAIHPAPQPQQRLSELSAFAASMFCYLWFDTNQSKPSKLQIQPTDRFLRFMHDVLTTTQVSHSVVILALLFVSRLKSKNPINGLPGSEFRASITALALGNKVLDDNTYTAKTWAEVSGLDLFPLVAGEQEFLHGLDWSCHVTLRDFNAWLRLLEGHIDARNAQLSKQVQLGRQGLPSLQSLSGGSDHGRVTSTVSSLLNFDGSVDRPTKRHRIEGSTNVFRRASDEIIRQAPATAATTPIQSFATFAFPMREAPASAPRPPPASAPLPAFAGAVNQAVSPLAQSRFAAARHSYSQSVPQLQQYQPSSAPASRPSSKRSAAEAFLDQHHASKQASVHFAAHLQSTNLARSYSAGNSPALPRTAFMTMGHYQPAFAPAYAYAPLPHSDNVQSRGISGELPSLAGAASPHRYPLGPRSDALGFYSLGAGAKGQIHHALPYQYPTSAHMQPQQPYMTGTTAYPTMYAHPKSRLPAGGAYAPAHPSHLSTSTSPDLSPRTQRLGLGVVPPVAHLPPSTAYANLFDPNFAPATAYFVPMTLAPSYRQFNNAGVPGVMWANQQPQLQPYAR